MNLANLFPQLREALRPKMFEGVSMRNSSEDKKKTKATQKGAVHKIGNHFLGRQILSMTPAAYRRLHVANPMAAIRKKLKQERKAKWISA